MAVCTSWYIIIINNTGNIIAVEFVDVTNLSAAVTWLRHFTGPGQGLSRAVSQGHFTTQSLNCVVAAP